MGLLALKLTDWGVQQAIASVPELRNKTKFARGTFSAVYDGTRADRVLKLTIDSAAYAYTTDGCAPQGPHRPETFFNFGDIGETSDKETIYLYEVERLHRIPSVSAQRQALYRAFTFARKGNLPVRKRRLPRPGDAGNFCGLEASLFPPINQFLDDSEAALDCLVGSNYMLRADGSLVASDPVFDEALMERAEKRAAEQRAAAAAYASRYGHR